MAVRKDLEQQRFQRNRFGRKQFSNNKPQTIEDKVKSFILRNSKNGFFTKALTIERKYEISCDMVWENIGSLLAENIIECIHDERTGDAKFCEYGKSYQILKHEFERKKQRLKEFKKVKQNPRR